MSTDQAVVIWGELLWDRFPDGDRLGGAPANVAWHLGQAGGWAQLVTRVGDDADGQGAIAAIASAGVFVYGTLSQRTPEGLAEWRRAADVASRCLRVCDLNLRP